MKRIKDIENFINENQAMFFDNSEIRKGMVRFYLRKPEQNRGFVIDVQQNDREILEEIFTKNDILYDVDEGGNLPF